MSQSGTGEIHVHLEAGKVRFKTLTGTYPLKLLSPRVPQTHLAVVYVLSYGGGLVSGDQILLKVLVESDSVLLLLSQGSTKIFKQRPARVESGSGATISSPSPRTTSQRFDFDIQANGCLLLLPDPVTCFQDACYEQVQVFHLASASSSSLVLLDWITSGRQTRGENWLFEKYYSRNEIWIENVRIANDALLLTRTDELSVSDSAAPGSLAERLAPYTCYAMLHLIGPVTLPIVTQLKTEYSKITVTGSESSYPPLLWSFSVMTSTLVVVRIAGQSTEIVRQWLGNHLTSLEDMVGIDLYRKTF